MSSKIVLSMKKVLVILLCCLCCLSASVAQEGSKIVSVKLLYSMSKKDISNIWKSKKIPKFIMPVKYDVDVYEVVYKAPWIDGTEINASGLYFMPKIVKGEELPVFVYHHGTQLEKARLSLEKSAEQGVALSMASDGYITLMPDYYGMGQGEGRHLYHHVWSQAMSTIHMLYAMDEMMDKKGLSRKNDIYLGGYSQGGHATMSAHKYLQEMNDPRYYVVAAAPLSGAFDMSGIQAEVLTKNYSNPFYLPYLLVGFQDVYQFHDGDVHEIFEAPYDSLIAVYNNGIYSANQFNKVLPKVPIDMLKPEYRVMIKDTTSKVYQMIAENNTYDWTPEAPILFCYCMGDEQVSPYNSIKAYETMKENGAPHLYKKNVSNDLGHYPCATFAITEMKFFFNNIRDGRSNLTKGDSLKRRLIAIYKSKKEKEYLAKQREKQRSEIEGLRAEAQD